MSAIPIFENMSHLLFDAIRTNNIVVVLELLTTLDMADQANENAIHDGLQYAIAIGNIEMAQLIRENTLFLNVDAGLATMVTHVGVEEMMRILDCDAVTLLRYLYEDPRRFEYTFDWLYSRDRLSHDEQSVIIHDLSSIIRQFHYNLRWRDNREIRELLNAYETSLTAMWKVVERYN